MSPAVYFCWACLCLLSISHPSVSWGWNSAGNSFGFSSPLGEWCSESWTSFNLSYLEKALDSRLFGQHLVVKLLPRHLKAHRSSPSNKALAVALHGSTGIGKTFVSQIVAQHLYYLGEQSKYFHRFIAQRDFPLPEHVRQYKNQLRSWISGNVSRCPNNFFVFEEIEKFPAGLLDEILPFLEPYAQIEGVDYRNAIFLFTTNLGVNNINLFVKDHYQRGKPRHELAMRVFDEFLGKHSYNQDGGFKYSALIQKQVIDLHIPFLPLERRHVKKCIEVEMKKQQCTITDESVAAVAEEVEYNSVKGDVILDGLFAKSGCKKLLSKVLLHC